MNYFELFGLPVAFTIDKVLLKKKYFELSRKSHPDYFANRDPSEQQQALEASAQLNKAFKTFSSEEETIKYVLELKGLLTPNEKYDLPQQFLMEMMELNEELSELPAINNGNTSANLLQRINSIENELYNEVKDIIENDKEDHLTNEKLLQIKDYYFKKKYLHRLYFGLGQKL
jgi:molecular chaperone HscB